MTNLYIIAKPNKKILKTIIPPLLFSIENKNQKHNHNKRKKKNLINIAESIYIELGILILEPGLSFQQQLF